MGNEAESFYNFYHQLFLDRLQKISDFIGENSLLDMSKEDLRTQRTEFDLLMHNPNIQDLPLEIIKEVSAKLDTLSQTTESEKIALEELMNANNTEYSFLTKTAEARRRALQQSINRQNTQLTQVAKSKKEIVKCKRTIGKLKKEQKKILESVKKEIPNVIKKTDEYTTKALFISEIQGAANIFRKLVSTKENIEGVDIKSKLRLNLLSNQIKVNLNAHSNMAVGKEMEKLMSTYFDSLNKEIEDGRLKEEYAPSKPSRERLYPANKNRPLPPIPKATLSLDTKESSGSRKSKPQSTHRWTTRIQENEKRSTGKNNDLQI